MAVATGQRQLGTVLAGQREIDIHEEILLLENSEARIAVITGMEQNERAIDPLFSWFNDELESRFDAVNNGAGYTSTDTSVVVDDGTLFAPEDLVKVPRTGEVVSVTSISTNTLTIERAIGASTAAALVDNDPLYIIGTSAKEGDVSQEARHQNPTKVDNYTQIFKHSVKASGSLLSSSNMTSPHDWPHQHKKAMLEHVKDIELAFLFGSPGTRAGVSDAVSTSTAARRTTGGLLHYLTQNNQDAGGTLTEAEFEQFLRTVTRYGGKHKTLFASRLVGSVLNQYAVGKLQTIQADRDTTYGLKVTEYQSIHGSVSMIVHDLLEGAVYGGYAIAADFKSGEVRKRYLNGDGPGPSRDTSVLTNRSAPDRDGEQDEILSECGLQVGLPKAHGVLTGVTG